MGERVRHHRVMLKKPSERYEELYAEALANDTFPIRSGTDVAKRVLDEMEELARKRFEFLLTCIGASSAVVSGAIDLGPVTDLEQAITDEVKNRFVKLAEQLELL